MHNDLHATLPVCQVRRWTVLFQLLLEHPRTTPRASDAVAEDNLFEPSRVAPPHLYGLSLEEDDVGWDGGDGIDRSPPFDNVL